MLLTDSICLKSLNLLGIISAQPGELSINMIAHYAAHMLCHIVISSFALFHLVNDYSYSSPGNPVSTLGSTNLSPPERKDAPSSRATFVTCCY